MSTNPLLQVVVDPLDDEMRIRLKEIFLYYSSFIESHSIETMKERVLPLHPSQTRTLILTPRSPSSGCSAATATLSSHARTRRDETPTSVTRSP